MNAMQAVEAALIAALQASPAARDVLGSPVRVFAMRPAGAALPYVRIARHEANPLGASETEGSEHRLSLDIITRRLGREEAMRLARIVRDALEVRPDPVGGHRFVLFNPVYTDAFLAADGITGRGLLRVRVISEPEGG
jgi:hypothetical protein